MREGSLVKQLLGQLFASCKTARTVWRDNSWSQPEVTTIYSVLFQNRLKQCDLRAYQALWHYLGG